jgi:uncharacterized protein (DUF2062 family)
MAKSKPIKWYSSPRTLLRYILLIEDTPHSIALGTAIGVFIGMTPTVGIQMIIVMIFSFLVKPFFTFNRMAALITVYISNPLTTIPIYWFNYKVGTLFVEGTSTRNDFEKVLHFQSFSEWWETIVHLFVGIGVPLISGSLVVAAILSGITYPLMWRLVRSLHPDPPETPQAEEQPVSTTLEQQ